MLSKNQNIIEAILFASGEPVNIKIIAKALNISINDAINEINEMIANYKNLKKGIQIIQIEEDFQFCTNPEYFEYIKKIYEVPKRKGLSSSLLETLAVIAYKQPITKSEIESIRGVNSDHCVNTLVKQGLVEEKDRLDAPGKPILFGTTSDFLKHFQFNKLSDFQNLIPKEKENFNE